MQMKKVVTALEASTTATTALASAILALAGGTRNVIFSPKRRTLTLEFGFCFNMAHFEAI